MNTKEHINPPDEESTPRPKADVRLDTESSVAELVELNRKNLPGHSRKPGSKLNS